MLFLHTQFNEIHFPVRRHKTHFKHILINIFKKFNGEYNGFVEIADTLLLLIGDSSYIRYSIELIIN